MQPASRLVACAPCAHPNSCPHPLHPLAPQAIEENKALLKAKYDEAKALGAAVNAAKGRVASLRGALDQRRLQRSAACERAGAARCIPAGTGV